MAELGDKIQLTNQEVGVEKCSNCGDIMVNLDAGQLATGDLTTLKNAGVKISNPETEDPICINCENRTFVRRVADFFEPDHVDNDDSSFFGGSGGSFGDDGGSSFSGFGGGDFSGGGASDSF